MASILIVTIIIDELRIEIVAGSSSRAFLNNLAWENINFPFVRWLNDPVHHVGRRVDKYQKVIITVLAE